MAYDPPPRPPLDGPLAPNNRLESAELLAVGKVNGPEDVIVDGLGRIYTGTGRRQSGSRRPGRQGNRVSQHGRSARGDRFFPDGSLVIADGVKGLLSLDVKGKITTLVTGTPKTPLGFADDLDVDHDGNIYFSDASSKFGASEYLYDMLEGRPHGRLLKFEWATFETSVVLGDLYFANGVALSQNEDFVLVTETYRFRVMRCWLTGERAGQSEVFIDNLPGYPDNITSNGRGEFWLALFTVRNEEADWLGPRPFVKSTLAKLPPSFGRNRSRYGFVIKLDENGRILDSFQDPTGKHLHTITSAYERERLSLLGQPVQ